ncbi:MAG TPA: hypothetical protein VK158_00230 [Acidobacteriota bacterium]|nr:hypothetical protein [Acidobacteriota bacterium]
MTEKTKGAFNLESLVSDGNALDSQLNQGNTATAAYLLEANPNYGKAKPVLYGLLALRVAEGYARVMEKAGDLAKSPGYQRLTQMYERLLDYFTKQAGPIFAPLKEGMQPAYAGAKAPAYGRK